MSYKPRYSLATPDTARGLTADLWRGSLEAYVGNEPDLGIRFTDDFVNRNALTGTTSATANDRWSAADAAAAGGTYSLTSTAGPDGLATLASTGTTNHFGVEAQGPPVVTTVKHSTAASRRGRVVAEFRFDKSTSDTLFIGFSEAGDNFLTATSTLPDTSDYVGFYTTDAGVNWSFVIATDNNGGTAVTDSFAIPTGDVESTGFQRFAFAINVDSTVEVAVNGKWYNPRVTAINPLAIPIETLVPRLSATAGGGTTAAAVIFDRVDVFVENGLAA